MKIVIKKKKKKQDGLVYCKDCSYCSYCGGYSRECDKRVYSEPKFNKITGEWEKDWHYGVKEVLNRHNNCKYYKEPRFLRFAFLVTLLLMGCWIIISLICVL